MSDNQDPSNWKFDTLVTRTHPIDPRTQPVALPIYTSSTYVLDSAEHGALLGDQYNWPPNVGEHSNFLYSRWGSPTCESVQKSISDLEGGKEGNVYGSLLFSSGMAAISTVILSIIKAGDHIVVSRNIYGGAYDFFNTVVVDFGVSISWVDSMDIGEYRDKITDKTVLLYGEVINNPSLKVLDVIEFAALGKEKGITTVLDNTFSTPYLLQPIPLGVDITVHSATKYLGGHSDILAGCASFGSEKLFQKAYIRQRYLGSVLSPFDSFLLGRGIKTLSLRMDRHCSSALKIAKYLENHPKISKVLYPGLESHSDHEIAKKVLKKGFGGMISFEVASGLQGGQTFIESLKCIHLAVSLGGIESLISQPATMTHVGVPSEKRSEIGITDGLIRFSVGIEDPDDIIQDIEQALSKI